MSDSFKGNNYSKTGGIKEYNVVATEFLMHEQVSRNTLSSLCVYLDVILVFDKCYTPNLLFSAYTV